MVKSIGADEAINYNSISFVEALKDTEKVDLVADMVGAGKLRKMLCDTQPFYSLGDNETTLLDRIVVAKNTRNIAIIKTGFSALPNFITQREGINIGNVSNN